MISSKTGLNQIFSSKVFGMFFWVQNDFLKNRFEPKNNHLKFFVKIFLVQNDFFENRFDPKILSKIFQVENF
jgi:hypothetical protein